ncbi:bis-aminopropyl spermidine synthase family protein [Paenibacillus senegalensis]|uniref:bis-aminopropyl spermidine synthase family protein n=1 Tax=Paenibacillus senegalensis TaxID=1465766 RepID=UPI0003073BE9|nr:bis-aminopropyl spermidine synthase family protein [Paenibacillus senegalensis]
MLHESPLPKEARAVLVLLKTIFKDRPTADVRIDQSLCTPETSLRRAILALQQHALLGKQLLCVGDDDLVSVSIGLLLRSLFTDSRHSAFRIDVVDMDERILHFIRNIAQEYDLPIKCRRLDLREAWPEELFGQYDAIFTDPPYTLQGMSLFLSRGIQALKKEKGLPVFLSFAHKSPPFMLAMQREFVRMGLTVSANFPRFNVYEGAEMIANQSQMYILRTTDQTEPEHKGAFTGALYTGEVKQTLRTYHCKQCSRNIYVGKHGEFATIELLKNAGCPRCASDTFELAARYSVSE